MTAYDVNVNACKCLVSNYRCMCIHIRTCMYLFSQDIIPIGMDKESTLFHFLRSKEIMYDTRSVSMFTYKVTNMVYTYMNIVHVYMYIYMCTR